MEIDLLAVVETKGFCIQRHKPELKIFAVPKNGSAEFEIDDLYWFEEQMIHNFVDTCNAYRFRFEVDYHL